MALPFAYTKGLLWERGWVQFAETFFFGWGVGFLAFKFVKLRHQQSALKLDVLPVDIACEVTKENVGSFIQHVYALPMKLRNSLMVNRIRDGARAVREPAAQRRSLHHDAEPVEHRQRAHRR